MRAVHLGGDEGGAKVWSPGHMIRTGQLPEHCCHGILVLLAALVAASLAQGVTDAGLHAHRAIT